MKLQPAQALGQNTFTGYGEGYVSVNTVRHTGSLIVLPQQVIPDWVSSFDALQPTDFALLASLDAEIILLGTGTTIRFPHPELLQAIYAARKGLDAMDLHAACRTYNVLVNEGRKVAAALIFS